jgi:hypothetical protein
MKKFLAVIAVLALTMVSSVAMAEITFDGSVEMMMRSIKNVYDWDDASTASQTIGTSTNQDTFRQTYSRLRFGINAKHDNVKARIQMETDWDTWADNASGSNPNPGFETRPTNDFYPREAWLDFTIPGAGPAHVKVGRQFLQLGNGWFVRSGKYGSDAWVVGLPGKNTIAFVDVKATEGLVSQADDTDVYVLLDTYKINDTNTVGAYIAHVLDRRGTWTENAFGLTGLDEMTMDNIGLHYSGKLGPVNLAAEIDWQMGTVKAAGQPDTDLSGYQIVVQANMPIDSLTLKATAAMGTGDDPNSTDEIESYIPLMDKDPHFTLVYEYFMPTAAGFYQANGNKNTAFSNTTALSLGAMWQMNKMIGLGADIWMLTADQKFNNNPNPGPDDDEIGNEIDVTLNLKLYDQVTWNTIFGLFMPGKGYESATGKADDATAIHSVLSYKF